MEQKRESALQRIQVGVIGLVVVLLFVSLASMVNERAFDEGDPLADNITQQKPEEEEVQNEPLAELGVAPVEDPEEVAEAKAAEENAASDAPNVQIEAEGNDAAE